MKSTHGNVTHGLSNHPAYSSWQHMMVRCYNPNHNGYRNYGGRGISVCAEWFSPEAFIVWSIAAGFLPGLQIDREDNDKNYEPGNCRWVTRKVNNRNKRTSRFLTAFGENKTVVEWSEDPRCAVKHNTLQWRLALGWEPERAITKASTRKK